MGYSESLNALFKKHIAENNGPLPEVLERVRRYLHGERAGEQDADTVKVPYSQPFLQSSGLIENAKDLELFCRTLTTYAICRFRKNIITPSPMYVISNHRLVYLSDGLAEDSLQDN